VRPRRRRFSLLEVALGQRPIKTFLAVPHRLPTGPVDEVVPPDHEDELQELLTWVFGDGATEPVITDSREIPTLANVIGDDEALSVLRRTRDLESATEMLAGEEQFLLRRITTAERAVRDITGLLPLYRDDPDVVAAVERLMSLLASLRRQLRA
jgi:hypothetical protein